LEKVDRDLFRVFAARSLLGLARERFPKLARGSLTHPPLETFLPVAAGTFRREVRGLLRS
jgi:hypothetical protein